MLGKWKMRWALKKAQQSLVKTKGKGLSLSAIVKNAAAKGETGVVGAEV